MDNPGYATLTRQTGLLKEMQVVANNIANMASTGYRREGVVFSEFVKALDPAHDSLSMAAARAHFTSDIQGALTQTGRPLDLAVEGRGYFLIQTPEGQMLTRAGNFLRDSEGNVVTSDGMQLLDSGGAAVAVPPDAAIISVASDGTLSADGIPTAEIGLWLAPGPGTTERRAGSRFAVDGAPVPAEEGSGRIVAGFLESSNVSPVAEVARMIEVQRTYELGQNFLDREDDRIRAVIRTFAR
jgi:flagellar basal-body rod protein FlgF